MPEPENRDVGNHGDGNADLKAEVMESLQKFQSENSDRSFATDNSATENADAEQRAAADSPETGSEAEGSKPEAKEETSKQVSSASEREAKQPFKTRSQLAVEAAKREEKAERERRETVEKERDDLKRRYEDLERSQRTTQKEQRPRYFYKEPPQKPETKLIKEEFVTQNPRSDVESEIWNAREAGDGNAEKYWRSVLREYDLLDRYAREFDRWQGTEGNYKRAYDDRKGFFDQLLTSNEQFKWLKDQNSPQVEHLKKICGDRNLTDVVKYLDSQPEGLWMMARWAMAEEKAARTDALEAKVKELEAKQVNKLKTTTPISSGDGAEDTGLPGDEDEKDPKKSVIQNIRRYQEANPQGRLTFAKSG